MVTDWDQIAAAGFAVPADTDVDALAADLAEAMADPDPRIRDGAAYAALATWIERGVLDRQLNWLGTTMAGRFEDPRIQARTFAALVLAWVVERLVWVIFYRPRTAVVNTQTTTTDRRAP